MQFHLSGPVRRMYRAGKSSNGILALIAGIGFAALGLVFLSGVWAGGESDAAALERQRQLVTQRLDEQVAQVSEAIDQVGSGYMSLLSANLSQHTGVEAAGAGENSYAIGLDSAETISKIVVAVFGYDRAFVVDGTGRLAMRSDAETTKRFLWIRPLLIPLLRERQKFEEGKSDPVRPEASADSRRRRAFAELMRLEGRPTIAGIAPISRNGGPGVGGIILPPEEMRFLIAIRFLDGQVLDDLSREQGLNGARFARSADPEENEVAVQIDAGATGEPIGFIVWSPDLPGSRVIGRLLPALSGAAFVIVVLFLLLLARLRVSLIELKLSEANARHLASHDVLTGLPNRGFFSDRLEECLRRISGSSQRSAIALIDLDRFKAINDSFGHAAGDELIRAAAERMQAIIRPCDTLARLGGDEFALLLRDIGSGNALLDAVADSLIAELKRPFYLRSGEVVAHVGGSIGMAMLPLSAGDAGEILRHADVALYEAKNQGRGRLVHFQPAMEDGRKVREILKGELRFLLGIQADSEHRGKAEVVRHHPDRPGVGNLELYFQTIHSAAEGHVATGAEALIRWHHPKHGLLGPSSFIPLAEEGGMIDSLGLWVLREACRAATNWPNATFVAVNVSPLQLRVPGFDEEVGKVLLEEGLAPSRLELEVTESALIADSNDVADTLDRLRARGIQISLDDFGTGYSSLSHLMQFGIDRIKIDRSFVSLLDTRADGAAIVSALVSLGRTLELSTTAEGIETEAQRDFLVGLGCTDLQGYLFSQPVPLGSLRQMKGFYRPSERKLTPTPIG